MKKRIRPNEDKCRFLGIPYKGRDNQNKHKRYSASPEQLEILSKYKPSIDAKKRIRSNYAENTAKILILDIETSPLNAYVWGLWKQNVNTKQIIKDWFVISWSAKWLFSNDVLNDSCTTKEIVNQNDKRICKSVIKLMDKADIIVAHNGDKFDLRKLNARFMYHRLDRPSSFFSVDTLKHARKHMAISSNKLDYLATYLGLPNKLETGGFELWDRCLKGEQKAINDMVKYCDQDVRTLETVYLELLPFIKPHPNVSLFTEDDKHRCPSCGGENLSYVSEYVTTMNKFDEYKCLDCGSHSRNKTANKSNKNKNSSLPR